MYRTRYKPDRPISPKEAIIMTKQLGMMHILYYIRGQMANRIQASSYMREMFGNLSLEGVILSWLDTENNLINHLSAWEENYKRDLVFKKSGISITTL